jgi:hypothetical protein
VDIRALEQRLREAAFERDAELIVERHEHQGWRAAFRLFNDEIVDHVDLMSATGRTRDEALTNLQAALDITAGR